GGGGGRGRERRGRERAAPGGGRFVLLFGGGGGGHQAAGGPPQEKAGGGAPRRHDGEPGEVSGSDGGVEEQDRARREEGRRGHLVQLRPGDRGGGHHRRLQQGLSRHPGEPGPVARLSAGREDQHRGRRRARPGGRLPVRRAGPADDGRGPAPGGRR